MSCCVCVCVCVCVKCVCEVCMYVCVFVVHHSCTGPDIGGKLTTERTFAVVIDHFGRQYGQKAKRE